ncbi:MAG: hypothetical protein SNJ74_10030 [Fimbriimonadaceae bacterium]
MKNEIPKGLAVSLIAVVVVVVAGLGMYFTGVGPIGANRIPESERIDRQAATYAAQVKEQEARAVAGGPGGTEWEARQKMAQEQAARGQAPQ